MALLPAEFLSDLDSQLTVYRAAIQITECSSDFLRLPKQSSDHVRSFSYNSLFGFIIIEKFFAESARYAKRKTANSKTILLHTALFYRGVNLVHGARNAEFIHDAWRRKRIGEDEWRKCSWRTRIYGDMAYFWFWLHKLIFYVIPHIFWLFTLWLSTLKISNSAVF